MNASELAYAAGFLDGEGHITVAKRGRATNDDPRYYLCVHITNTNLEVLNWFQNRFGGTIQDHTKDHKTNNDSYRWYVAAKQAYAFLNFVEPLLIVKKRQAILCIAFQHARNMRGNVGNNKLPTHIKNFEFTIYTELRKLNHRGKSKDE